MAHDNIVKLHEYTENDKEFVLFMEYCNDANYFEEKLVNVSLLANRITRNVAMQSTGLSTPDHS